MKLIKQIFECKSVQTEQKWPNMTYDAIECKLSYKRKSIEINLMCQIYYSLPKI